MILNKIEEIIKLVKSNDVKKFKYKDFENEIELDFTESYSNTSLKQSSTNNQAEKNNEHQLLSQHKDQTTGDFKEIKSPMVGTFFLQDSKDLTKPMINVGDQINEGDIIAYIEAMKVMNEVVSDISGEVTDILIEHGKNVEYDQVIVKIK
ncbi:acetyl-CoA carboxylase biotin carboxyl carrier protein [Staphylococcus saccharolyticus]|uniref:acetyl-CoA carboxylase biotin carboxyl carrier protein n=1 Tax=Staphylococcus saccharolyticus TaxID=33028 RepID=UPI0032E048C4